MEIPHLYRDDDRLSSLPFCTSSSWATFLIFFALWLRQEEVHNKIKELLDNVMHKLNGSSYSSNRDEVNKPIPDVSILIQHSGAWGPNSRVRLLLRRVVHAEA
jgi:hypothetical protein